VALVTRRCRGDVIGRLALRAHAGVAAGTTAGQNADVIKARAGKGRGRVAAVAGLGGLDMPRGLSQRAARVVRDATSRTLLGRAFEDALEESRPGFV
jgi:hypothetical protein